MDKNKPFPECAKDCEAIKILGAGECESVCGHKFDTNRRQLTIPAVSKSVCPECSSNDYDEYENRCRCNKCGRKWEQTVL